MIEKQLQNKVIEDLENNAFAEKIINPYSKNVHENKEHFGIYKIIIDLYESSVQTIINSLKNQDFDIINGREIKNISMGKDKLYADILIKGIENQKYYVIELKVNKSTSRETVTELMAYRHEIKNHLPFISNEDVVLVIISLEYSSLLKHAVSSLLLDNISVLCLKPIMSMGEIISYTVEDILAWSDIEVKKINKKMFEGYSLYLFSKVNEEKIEKKVIDQDRMFAIEYYKADANMYNTNGICVIWDHYKSIPTISNTSSDYAISIFKINPYCATYENLSSESDVLSKYIVENIYEHDNLESSGLQINQSSNKLHSILSKKYSPQYGEFATFHLYEEKILNIAQPLYCDAWGRLGQQIKDMYYDYCETLFKGKHYTEPTVFMKIFNYLFEEYPFYNDVGIGEYFYFGIYLKCLENSLKSYAESRSLRLWIQIERIWSVIFCSFLKYPDLGKDMQLVEIKQENIDQNINVIGEYIKFFANSSTDDKKKQAFKMGCRYWYVYLDSLGNIIYLEELEDLCFDNELPSKLSKYFFDNFIELIDKIKQNEIFEDRMLGCVGHILSRCSREKWSNKEGLINTITTLEPSKLKYGLLDDLILKSEMRNLLNYNS